MKNLNQVKSLLVLDNFSKLNKRQQVNSGFTKSQNKESVKGRLSILAVKKKKILKRQTPGLGKNKGTNIGFWGAF